MQAMYHLQVVKVVPLVLRVHSIQYQVAIYAYSAQREVLQNQKDQVYVYHVLKVHSVILAHLSVKNVPHHDFYWPRVVKPLHAKLTNISMKL